MLEKFVVEPIISNAERFSKEVFNSLAPFAGSLLAGSILLWITWAAYNALVEGEFAWRNMVKKILIFTVIGSMLTVNNKIFYGYIYDPIKYTTNEFVNNILSIAPQSGLKQFKDPKQAIDKIDASFSELVSLVTLVSKKANLGAAFFAAIVTFVIWGLFIMSEAMFALYLVGNNLKLAAISALSPLLILAFAFDQTRHHAIGGLKYVLASALTLLIASFCMALILLALRKFVLDLQIETLPADEVFSTLSSLLILAIASIYFLKLAPELASAIMGANVSSIMAGVVGGAMAGVALSTNKIGGMITGSKAKVMPFATDKSTKENVESKFADNYTPRKEE